MSGENRFVFAYGSLMWRPDFPHIATMRATLHGYHRSLCHYSNHYRGTAERPGLVFGLDVGGSCEGLAFEVAAADWPEAYKLLHAREMNLHSYHEAFRPIVLEDQRRLPALCYVMNRTHALYAGALATSEIVRLVSQGEGIMGRCIDYVTATDSKLRELGIKDRYVREIAEILRDQVAEG